MLNRSVLGLFAASCLFVALFCAPAQGQLGLPNIFGNAQNLAVSRALSEFGKSLGHQIPIDVADGDAYPTVPKLSGGTFRPGAPPANLLSKLRSSTDGTDRSRPAIIRSASTYFACVSARTARTLITISSRRSKARLPILLRP